MGSMEHVPMSRTLRAVLDELADAHLAWAPHPESAVSDSGVEVHGFCIPSSAARWVWNFLRVRHEETGWYPFLGSLAPGKLVEHDRGGKPWGGGSRQLLETALARNTDQVIADLTHSAFREMADIHIPPQSEDDLQEIEEARLLFNPEHTTHSLRPNPPIALSRTPDRAESMGRDLWLNLVHAQAGHELPALFPRLLQTPNWSGFPNRQLLPVDHVAVLRHWHKMWGADFYYADSVALELLVKNPPLDRHSAAKVAVEQYVYCPDWSGDPEAVGNGQVRSSMWSFWWD